MRKFGFTLAEVLITLGIIGVVAAMTLPGLMQSWNDKASVTKVKKAYSLLNQAYLMSKEQNGPVSEWEVTTPKDLTRYFTPYIKNIRICTDKEKDCSSRQTYDLTGKSYNNKLQYYAFIDAGGMAYTFASGIVSMAEAEKYGGSRNLNETTPHQINMYQVIVNIDNKGVLRWGINTFIFFITDKGIVPYGVIGWSKQKMCDPTTPSSSPGWWNGMGCAGWVISEGNMDYVKCTKGNKKYCERGNYNP